LSNQIDSTERGSPRKDQGKLDGDFPPTSFSAGQAQRRNRNTVVLYQ